MEIRKSLLCDYFLFNNIFSVRDTCVVNKIYQQQMGGFIWLYNPPTVAKVHNKLSNGFMFRITMPLNER